MDYKELIQKAIEAMDNSYSPYSHYRSGAALLAEDGTVYTGCNVENASFGLTCSAESAAFFKAVSEGKRDFVRMAVVGGQEGIITDFCRPSGECRQIMSEFCNPILFEVVLAKSPSDYQVYALEELMPLAFGPKHL